MKDTTERKFRLYDAAVAIYVGIPHDGIPEELAIAGAISIARKILDEVERQENDRTELR